MGQLKRVVSLVMTIVLMLSIVPVQAFAEEIEPLESVSTIESTVENIEEKGTEALASDELTEDIQTMSIDVDNTLEGNEVAVKYYLPGQIGQYGDSWVYYYNNESGEKSVTTSVTVENCTKDYTLKFYYIAYEIGKVTISESTVAMEAWYELPAGESVTLFVEIPMGKFSELELKSFSLSMASAGNTEFVFDEQLGEVQIDGTKIQSGHKMDLDNSTIMMTAEEKNGSKFLGWINGETGEVLSANTSYELRRKDGLNQVEAVFAVSTERAWFSVKTSNFSYLFDDLNTAVNFASNQSSSYRLITLAYSGVLEEGNYTIPSGTKLLIPYTQGDSGTFSTILKTSEAKPGNKQDAFCTLYMQPNAILNVVGQLNVNGRVYKQNGELTGRCTDTYGHINLANGAQINLATDVNGGKGILYCYGYITGEGTVTAYSGTTVYEVFQLTGWTGGSSAYGWDKYKENLHSFVLNDYAVQNIEATYVIYSGATAAVAAAVTVDTLIFGEQTTPASMTYMGSNSGLIRLGENAVVTRSFTPSTNRMKYSFAGNVTIANINISLDLGWFGTVDLDSADYILAIPHNMDFEAISGLVTLANSYKIMPGATLTVGSNARAQIDGKLYVYDTADYMSISGKSATVKYVATTGQTTGFPRINSSTFSGKIVVDGELTIGENGAFYTTENGGDSLDKVISGTGIVINKSNASAVDTYLDEIEHSGSSFNAKAERIPVTSIPVVGRLAGISEAEGYDSFIKGTYYGLDKGWWYQYSVNITGDLGELKAYNGSVISTKDNITKGYSCSGGMVQFSVPFNYSVSCDGATITQAAAAGSARMVYSVPVESSGITVDVNEESLKENNAIIKMVSSADKSVVSTQECYIPEGTDVKAYYSDESCTKKADKFVAGTTLYMLVSARVGENAYYTTLEDAISNAAGNDVEVTLLSDVQITDSIKVAAEQDININLNGHIVTYSSTFLSIEGCVDLDLQGGSIKNAQGAEVSALIVRNGGALNLDVNSGSLLWSDYGVEGYSFSAGTMAALVYCHDGGIVNINIDEEATMSVVHPNAVTKYTLHAIYNAGTMTIEGAGEITSSAYTATTGAYVNDGSDTYNAAPPVVNTGSMTIQNGTTVSATSTNGTKNYSILNYNGGNLTLDGAEVSCASGYALYNWGATIDTIKDTTISGTNGICNYNNSGYDHTATITEIVGETTINGISGYALSTHPDTYVGIIGGEGSTVELIAIGNAINANQGVIGELADGLTIISTGGNAVYTKGIVEKVSGGYYYAGSSVFRADTGTDETPFNASITIVEGYDLAISVVKRTLRDGSVYGCTYLTQEEQDYPSVLTGHLQMLPDNICGDTNIWSECNLVHETTYHGGSSWTKNGDVVSITIPINAGDRIYANSFGVTTLADGSTKSGIRVTWFGEDGILENGSIAPASIYSTFVSKGYITAPAGAIAVNIPMWLESDDNVVNILGHDYQYVDEDSDGFYTAVCSACGIKHEGLLEHLQVPESYCYQTNLWSTLTPELCRRTADEWKNDYYSITFPVKAGDKIYANSFGTSNSTNGIRITWFYDDGKVKSFAAAPVYNEFIGKTDETTGLHYITAPAGAVAICVPMWKNEAASTAYILSGPDHPYEEVITEPTCVEGGYTTYTCVCGNSYIGDEIEATGEHKFTNYVSNNDATAEKDGTKTAVCDYGCGTEHTTIDEGSSDVYKALKGKVISVMGDSISTFAGWIPTEDGFNLEHYARYPQDNLFNDVESTWWHQLIFDELDAKLGVNESWRSTEIGNVYDVEVNSGYEGTKACMASMTRIQNLGSNGTPDLILFYGGTNDITQRNNADIPRVLGTFDEGMVPESVDLTTDKWDTVIEAYVTALMRMHHFYPETRIVCMFPTVTTKNTKAVVSTYNAEFKEVCDYFIDKGYDIVYVDLLDSGVTTSHLPDGTHPNAEGMDLITAAVKEKLLNTCKDINAGEHIVHSVTHQLSSASATLGYYKGVDAGADFAEIIRGEELTVTVVMDEKDITDSVCTMNPEKTEAYISVSKVSGDLIITAEGISDFDELYADRLQEVPSDICSGVNLLDRLNLDTGFFTGGDWNTNKYYSLTISVEEGQQFWATSFQAAGLNGATNTSGVRITWFMSDGTANEVEPTDVYTEFKTNGYITVPANAVALNIPLRNNNSGNVIYMLGLEHSFDTVDNNDGTETLTCSKCGQEFERAIGQYLVPYIQLLPKNAYNTTNLWPLLNHNEKYYKTTVNEKVTAYSESTWNTNNDVRSVTVPVGSGYRVYATSFTVSTGIRTTWFFENETFVSWSPAQTRAKFLANTDEETGLHYIQAPEGAIAVNVAMWNGDDSNVLYILDLPSDPLTLNDLSNHLRQLPEPCYNTTNIWAELAETELDGEYWTENGWGKAGEVKSVTIPVNGGDKIKASSFGTSEGGNGIRVSWFLADGTVDTRSPRTGSGNVYDEYTANGYLTAPENAVAVCVPMWVVNDSCELYNLSLPDDPLKANDVIDHLVELPDPCYNDTNIWAELAESGKLDEKYWTSSGWGVLTGAKSVTVRVNGGDKITASSFGKTTLSDGKVKNGIRVTWFMADGTKKSLTPDETYAEFSSGNCLTAPANAIAVCVPMWEVTDDCEFYNLSLPSGPASEPEDYKGKVISIMGDSISTFAGYTPEDDGFNLDHRNRYPQSNLSTDVNETWWMQVLTALDAKLGINDSWAGSRVNNTLDENSGDLGPDAAMASLTRIQNLGSNGTPDVIMVFGGTNDRGQTIGTFDSTNAPTIDTVDLTSYKWDTFVDAYAAMITRMQYYYPNAEIVAMLPYMPNAATLNAEIVKICKHYGVVYVDLMNCGISTGKEDLPDGLHPSAKGFDYITDAVLETLFAEVEMTAGENTVYSITHSLQNVTASKHYYKGVSAGVAFTETLVSNGNAQVTVTMAGVDVTSDTYNTETGTLSISSVQGDLAISAVAEKTMADRVQQVPENTYRDTNLWTTLTPDEDYYSDKGLWETTANSITFSINEGDQIWATAFGASGTNGSTVNGIRVTWFNGDEVLKSMSPAEVYTEFSENGFLTAPAGATAVCVPAWTVTGFTNVVNIVSLPTVYDDHLMELDRDVLCSGIDFWDLLKEDWEDVYWDSAKWATKGNLRSVTIPVQQGDQIWASVFGTTTQSNGTTNTGIRVTWFSNTGVLKSEYISAANGNLSTDGYVTAPENAIAINIPVWDYKIENDMYIRSLEHSYENGFCTKCEASDMKITHYGQNLRLQDLIKIGYYFTVTTAQDVQEVGALLWTAEQYAVETNFTVTNETAKQYANLKKQQGAYVVETDGIYAQNLDNKFVLMPYVLTERGYTYGEPLEYCALDYIKKAYESDRADLVATKSLVIDLANYATAARAYFCMTENLPEPAAAFNNCLAAADRIVKWDDTLNQSYPTTVESAEFEEKFAGRNVNLREAISIGLYYQNTDVTGAHYWNAADYVANHEPTGAATIERASNYVKVNVTGLYAYNIYDMYYVRSYNANGEMGACYGTSVASYLTVAIDKYKDDPSQESQALVALCQAMQVYGKNASTNTSINRPK